MSGTDSPFREYSHLLSSRLHIHHNPNQDKEVTLDECCCMYVEGSYTHLPDSCVFIPFGMQSGFEKACLCQQHVCLYCAYFLVLASL